jgi:TMEM175 potassium channel family protein
MEYADSIVVRLNLAPLMTVSFLPFPTKLMAEALHEKSGEQAAVLFYGGTLLVITSLLAGMGRYAARVHLFTEDDTRAAVRRMADRLAPSLGFYAIVTLLAIFAPPTSNRRKA